jgi:hypothetical protein
MLAKAVLIRVFEKYIKWVMLPVLPKRTRREIEGFWGIVGRVCYPNVTWTAISNRSVDCVLGVGLIKDKKWG